jgi:hypothetical protein
MGHERHGAGTARGTLGAPWSLAPVLVLVVVLVLVAAVPALTASAAGGAAAGRAGPAVDQAATPAGWLPVDYGNAQVSVPASWMLISDGAASCGPSAGALILAPGTWCPPGMGEAAPPGTTVATLSVTRGPSGLAGQPLAVVNGIQIYAPGIAPVYVAPALDAELSFSGPPLAGVWHTLTFSPRAVALAAGQSPAVPRSWRSISFDGLRFAVPAAWAVAHTPHAPPCGTDIVLPQAGATLATGPPLPLPCPLPEAEVRPVPQVAGVEVDGYPGHSSPPGRCVGPRTIGTLHACVDASPAYQVLVVQLWTTGRAPVTVKIGLAGSGSTGRTILHSFQPS